MQRVFAPIFASLALAATLPAQDAAAAYRCDNPGDIGDRRACAYAAQGPDALRRFIERTRGIYILDYRDYVQPAKVATRTRRATGAAASRAKASRG
jgi:hypothetical protein